MERCRDREGTVAVPQDSGAGLGLEPRLLRPLQTTLQDYWVPATACIAATTLPPTGQVQPSRMLELAALKQK